YRYIGRDFADRTLTNELLEALETVQDASAAVLHSEPPPLGPRSPADTGRTPFPLEHLPPYLRGVNFALQAISERVAEDERLQKETITYRASAQEYMRHGVATLKPRESLAK